MRLVALVTVAAAAGCGGSSAPSTPPDPWTVRIAHLCDVDPADTTFAGDSSGYAGPILVWTTTDDVQLVVSSRLDQDWALTCHNNGRTIPLPHFDESRLPAR